MKYVIDHDYHIHSYLSPCSGNPEQNAERICTQLKDISLPMNKKGIKQVGLAEILCAGEK